MRKKNALFHGKPLFVVATSDTEDVTLPFVTESIAGNLLRDFLVVEDTAGGEDEMDDEEERNRAHVFLSSSTSMSFWFPVAGSEADQLVFQQCCRPCLLAMLNFILSGGGKPARTRHAFAWLKQGLVLYSWISHLGMFRKYSARDANPTSRPPKSRPDTNCEFLVVHALRLLTAESELPWVVCTLLERAFVGSIRIVLLLLIQLFLNSVLCPPLPQNSSFVAQNCP